MFRLLEFVEYCTLFTTLFIFSTAFDPSICFVHFLYIRSLYPGTLHAACHKPLNSTLHQPIPYPSPLPLLYFSFLFSSFLTPLHSNLHLLSSPIGSYLYSTMASFDLTFTSFLLLLLCEGKRVQRAYVRTDSGLRGSISVYDLIDEMIDVDVVNLADYIQVRTVFITSHPSTLFIPSL